MTMRGPMTSPTPSRRWPLLLASWALMSMRFSRCGLVKKISGLFTMWQKIPKGHLFLLGSASPWITQDHGLKRNPFPWGPEMMKWSVLLPVVWEGGAEWRHGGKPPVNESLPPGPHLQLVPRIIHNQHWHYVPSLTAVPAVTAMMMLTLLLARISSAPSNSCHQQSVCGSHSTLVFMPGWVPPTSSQQFNSFNIPQCNGAHCP